MARLEHVGIAVEDAEAAAQLYETLLGVRPYKAETVAREGVRTHFISAQTAKLELLEALGADSPVAKHLARRGQGLHHLAFEVDDIEATMQRLSGLGFQLLSDTPRPGADGKRIVFLHPKQTHGVLVEFCQSTPTGLPPTLVPFRGGHLAAYVCGDARNPALVMLHGAQAATLPTAEPLIRRLEQHYHLLALDFAGQGGSTPITAPPATVAFYADQVQAMMDHVSCARAHVLGFGFGGTVALHLARHHPEAAHRLAVHAPDATTPWHPDPPDDDLTALLDTDALEAIDAPVLVSTCDPAAPMAPALHLRATLPNATLAVLPGTGSGWAGLDAEAYALLLRRWLSGTS